MEAAPHPPAWKSLSAFAIIYFVWGSTFLAIRIGVHEVPPFLFAGMRFLVAGLVLYLWMLVAGRILSQCTAMGRVIVAGRLDFRSRLRTFILVRAACAFGNCRRYSGDDSGIHGAFGNRSSAHTAAYPPPGLALSIGIGGVAVLMSRSLSLGGEPIDPKGATALIVAAISWSIASALTRKLPLPPSKVMSSGAQMLAGGVFLAAAAAARGEFRDFHPSTVSRGVWLSLLYLIVAGSIVAYTAYVWLLHHESPTKVGTYAYVNPVVAVLIGYSLGGEALGARTILGTSFILISVVVITTTRSNRPPAVVQVKDGSELLES